MGGIEAEMITLQKLFMVTTLLLTAASFIYLELNVTPEGGGHPSPSPSPPPVRPSGRRRYRLEPPAAGS
ncbi:hypothetical protein KEJ44_08710 [Candidatus Bathyarchaeota archaeon]|nr:hypothetical protein [Candidatus Bathyarchaeota archaeon]